MELAVAMRHSCDVGPQEQGSANGGGKRPETRRIPHTVHQVMDEFDGVFAQVKVACQERFSQCNTQIEVVACR